MPTGGCALAGANGEARSAAASTAEVSERRPIIASAFFRNGGSPRPLTGRRRRAVERARFVSEPILRVARAGGRARVTLARPAVRNAFNAELIARLRDAFAALAADPSVRLVVLDGEGSIFCGGADVNWRRGALELRAVENLLAAEALSALLPTLHR